MIEKNGKGKKKGKRIPCHVMQVGRMRTYRKEILLVAEISRNRKTKFETCIR